MEKLLARLARQLDAIDEASLTALWSKYATLAGRFEPTQRWEEAVLIFALIEAKRMKNQLFNYYWAQQVRSEGSDNKPAPEKLGPLFRLETPAGAAPASAPAAPAPKRPCRILAFSLPGGEEKRKD